jgi:hypothetical protein
MSISRAGLVTLTPAATSTEEFQRPRGGVTQWRGAPSAQAASCAIDPQTDPVTDQVGTELTYFITVTGCASSNKQPSFKVVDGRLPSGTRLFDFAGSSGLINGVPTTAGSFTFTVQVKTRPVRPTPRPSRSISSRPRRRRSPLRRSPAERLASSTAAATCSPAVVSSLIRGLWSPGHFLPVSRCRGGKHHLRHAHHGCTFTFTVRVTDDLDTFSERSSPSRSPERQAAVWVAAASCRWAGVGRWLRRSSAAAGSASGWDGREQQPGRSTCTNGGLVQSRSCSVRMTRPCCR